MKFGEKLIKVGLALLITGLLPGCQSEVEVAIPAHEPKLAIRYMLGNVAFDSITAPHFPDYQAYVSQSQSLFSIELPQGINNAELVVTDAVGNVVETLKQGIRANVGVQGNGYYQPVTNFTATPGEKYTFTVSAAGFNTVTSSLIMPSAVSGLQGSYTQTQAVAFGVNGQDITGQLTVTFPDNGAESNYYLLYGVLLDHKFRANARDVFQEKTESDNIEIAEDFKDIHFSGLGLSKTNPFDDKTFNGNTLTLTRKVNLLIGNVNLPPRYLRVYVHSVTQDTFRFMKSLQTYSQNTLNPFAEATRVIGNVENGYGYFGGYTSFYVDIPLP